MSPALSSRPVLAGMALLPLAGLSEPLFDVSLALFIMAGVAAAVGLVFLRHRPAPRPGVSALLLALLAITVLSLLANWWADDPTPSVVLSTLAAAGLASAAAAGAGLRDEVAVRRALGVLITSGAAVSLWALVTAGEIQPHEGGAVVAGRLVGPFAQPNELGAACASLLPIALAMSVDASSRLRRAASSVAALIVGAALVLSFSRSAWMGAAVGVAFLSVMRPPVRRVAGVVGAAAGMLGLIAWNTPAHSGVLGAIGARLRTMTNPGNNPYDDRPGIAAEAWRQISDAPVFGSGLGSYQSAASSAGSAVAAATPLHPHDALLTLGVELGLVGVSLGALVVAAFVRVLQEAHRHARMTVGSLVISPAAGLVSMGAHGLTDMPLRHPILTMLLWSFFGVVVACDRLQRQAASTPSITRAGDDDSWLKVS